MELPQAGESGCGRDTGGLGCHMGTAPTQRVPDNADDTMPDNVHRAAAVRTPAFLALQFVTQ